MKTVFFANSSRLVLSLFLLPRIFAISCKEQSFEAHGMLQIADSFLMASRRLQALCYKADIEAARRTSGSCGFQLLDLHDFHGQEIALVGVLDPFGEEKGYISPEEHSQYCNETVPLARFKRMIFKSYKKIEIEMEVAHYGVREFQSIVPAGKIIDKMGNEVLKGQLEKTNLTWGNCKKTMYN